MKKYSRDSWGCGGNTDNSWVAGLGDV